jgi:hypothetical protein
MLTPAYEAVTSARVPVTTVPAVAVKDAVVAPWGMLTDAGTVTAALFELESATVTPPLPAGDEIVTLPVSVSPFTIKLWLRVKPVKARLEFTVKPNPSLAPM